MKKCIVSSCVPRYLKEEANVSTIISWYALSMKSKIFFIVFLLASCTSRLDLPIIDDSSAEVERLSVSSASKLLIGDDQTQVIKVLGTPNIITRNKTGDESWVFDRVSEQYEFVQNNNSREFIFQKPDQRVKEGRSSKTFIVIIDFDDSKLIKDISYRFTQY